MVKNRGLRIKTFMRDLCEDEEIANAVAKLEKEVDNFTKEIEENRGIVYDIIPYATNEGAIRSIVVKYSK